mgnify:CR=1 FL=1
MHRWSGVLVEASVDGDSVSEGGLPEMVMHFLKVRNRRNISWRGSRSGGWVS